ncbi:MAG: HEPN domain-containing protein [Deltaproteobacteria bacterium]|nr:HEPN domain-containing protein [Deltaproteobacteria bacterium]
MKGVELYMARAKKFARPARLLIDDEDFDSAVPRTYYAMFSAVQALLLTRGLTFSSHKAVISAFSGEFVKTGIFKKESGKAVRRAFEKRQISDYMPHFAITGPEAAEMLEEGEAFIRAVEEYLGRQGS